MRVAATLGGSATAHPPRQPTDPALNVEITSWLDDCTRYALHVSAHTRVTTPIEVETFRETLARHGNSASTLTNKGKVYVVRLAGHGRHGGKDCFEAELSRRHIVQKNTRPGPPPAARPSGPADDEEKGCAQNPPSRPRSPSSRR